MNDYPFMSGLTEEEKEGIRETWRDVRLFFMNLGWKIKRKYLELRYGKYSLAIDSDPVHTWFELSYAHYLTIPRSILQSMPVNWQRDFVKCLEELDETFDWRPQHATYWVSMKKNGKFMSISRDPFVDYERGRKVWTKEEIKQMGENRP